MPTTLTAIDCDPTTGQPVTFTHNAHDYEVAQVMRTWKDGDRGLVRVTATNSDHAITADLAYDPDGWTCRRTWRLPAA